MKNFKHLQHKPILDANQKICNGSYIIDEQITIRTKNGYLNDDIDPETGSLLPAIELSNSTHIEHWKNGVLHCENEPAVIDLVDDYEEWWVNGIQVLPKEKGEK